ncbi:32570_t:CDS:1, partial [Racocetra persica]
ESSQKGSTCYKKAKIERSDSSIINEEVDSNIIVNQADKRENIFYDLLK